MLLLFSTVLAAEPCTFTATVSTDGVPENGAPVILAREAHRGPVAVFRATTDSSGTATFTGLPAGSYRATAAAPDRVPGTMRPVRCSDGDALVGALVLKPADAWFDGKVLDHAGEPLDGTVRILATAPASTVFRGAATIPVDDGAFRVGVVSGIGYDLTAFVEGHRPQTARTRVPTRGENQPVELRVAVASTIEGIVVDPFGKPVEGAHVHRMPVSTELATTDAKGRFTLSVQPGALHRVSAIKDELVATVDLGVLAEGESRKDVQIALEPGRTVHGTVRDEGTRGPVGDTTVIWRATGTGLVVEVPVAADGTFVADGVPFEWEPDPSVMYSVVNPKNHVTFFVSDPRNDAARSKVTLPPVETEVAVPFARRGD